MSSRLFHSTAFAVWLGLIILLMLPCPLKQEVKRSLDIPVAQVPGQFSQKSILCSTYIASSADVQYEQSTLSKSPLGSHCAAPHAADRASQWVHTVPFVDTSPPTAVPYYILHEQYLI